jgi:methylated-DNA-[protein]-cysteine S-methyltransferase
VDLATYVSPIGPLRLAARGDALVAVRLPDSDQAASPGRENATPMLVRAMHQLAEYFAGQRTRFDLALALDDSTPFQRAVWTALCDIPYGAVSSYGAIAVAIGQPTASRAVGMANHNNPIAIIVPCHRVIGASGALTGYGGGLATKQFLLDLERGQRTLAF